MSLTLLALLACRDRGGISGGTDDTQTTQDTAPIAEGPCAEVQALMSTHCTGCHAASAPGGLDLRDLRDLAGQPATQVPEMALLEPGDREASYFWHKVQDSHASVGGTGQLMPPSGKLDAAELALLGEWIDAGASCEEGEDVQTTYDPNDLDQDALFTCEPGTVSSSPARIRRLNDVEWRSTIGHKATSPAASNPLAVPASARFSTYAEDVGMDEATLDLYLNLAHYGGGGWSDIYPEPDYSRQHQPQKDSSFRCIYQDAEPDSTCIDTYLRAFLEGGAYYRPPTDDELTRLRAFADQAFALEASEGWTRQETLVHINSAAWLSTGALFRSELGGDPDSDGLRRLGPWEQARMMGHMLDDRAIGAQGVFRWGLGAHSSYDLVIEGNMPELQAAAADGSISDPEVASALLRLYAMGTDPDRTDTYLDWGDSRRSQARAEEWLANRIDHFFLEFFDVEDFPTLFKDTPEATTFYEGSEVEGYIDNSFGNLQSGYYGHEPTMLQLFEDTIARIVVQDHDVLAELLTTRTWYLASTTRYAGSSISASTDYTNRIFDVEGDIGDESPAHRWADLPSYERAGMLTHPAWLATHGDAFEDGPSAVSRGHWIREHLFCQSVLPLEFVNVPAQLIESDGTLRARDRIDESIEGQAECMVCHQDMNSLGMAFEIYNHAGMLRADDHGYAPDGSTYLDNAPDPALNGSYVDAIELTEALAGSDYVKRCFVRQTFRYFAGRDETMADACVLSEMELAYDDSGGSFVSMLEVMATHDALLMRHTEEEGEN